MVKFVKVSTETQKMFHDLESSDAWDEIFNMVVDCTHGFLGALDTEEDFIEIIDHAATICADVKNGEVCVIMSAGNIAVFYQGSERKFVNFLKTMNEPEVF